MSDQEERVDLQIERRDPDFALVRKYAGSTTEIVLLEMEILALARIFPSYARALLAARSRPESGTLAWAAAPIVDYVMSMDAHNQAVLMRFHDDTEAEFDFAITPNDARKLAKSLEHWADRVENAPEITRQ